MSAVTLPSEFIADDKQSRVARRNLLLRVGGETPRNDEARLLLRNLSPHGFNLESAEPLVSGDQIVVYMPGGRAAAAQVVWADGSCAGCAFDTPLSKGELSAALLAADAAPGDLALEADWAPVMSALASTQAELRHWPRPVRLAILVGASVALWAMIAIALF
jgi:hypothetical protein